MEKKSYSLIYRTMHWMIAISFVFILLTIFLRSTWLDKNHIASIIQDFLKDSNQKMSQDQILDLARKIRNPMFEWHIYIGYVLVGLFTIRFILPLFGEMKFQNPFAKNLSIKVKFQKWTYLIFYVCVIGSLTTGLLLEFGPENIKEPVEDIHTLGLYYLIPFIAIHLAGILIAEFTNQNGLISRIISGSKDKQ